MSDAVSVPAPPASVSRGAIVISFIAQLTFFLALAAACAIAWFKQDYTLVTAMAGVAATNATTVIGYWVGTSNESVHKTSLLGPRRMAP